MFLKNEGDPLKNFIYGNKETKTKQGKENKVKKKVSLPAFIPVEFNN